MHAAIGKLSFDADKLQENFAALMDNIVKLKPAAAKGTYVKAISFSSTMGPGLRVDAVKAQATK